MFKPEDIALLAKRCEDPVWFAENFLGVQTWSKQRELLYAVRDHQSVAIRSGHKTSKSFSYMILALWWAVMWHLKGEDARVALSAASFNQVKDIAWREIRHMYRTCKPLQQLCEKPPSLDPATGLTLKGGQQIFGFSTTEAENAAGISSPHNLYLLDEAAGIQDKVFEAMEGNMAGGAKMVMASQATRMTGFFKDAFHKNRKFWHCIQISSWESPNVTGEKEIPGLATEKWCRQKREQWGETNPLYKVRVMGEFPGMAENSVIGLSDIKSATMRWHDASDMGRLRIGVDVARFGDDETVIFPVRGEKALDPVIMHGSDGYEVAAKIIDTVRRLRRGTDTEIDVKIDEIGLGSSPIDALEHMELTDELGIKIKPLHVQANAHDESNNANLGTEMAFGLADWIRAGGCIPDDSILIEELTSTTYEIDVKGRRKIARKKDIKKLIKHSPNRREALEMAIYDPKSKFEISSAFVEIM